MNNQNDFELIEPVKANSPSTFLLEIATIKDILHWSAFIAKVDDTSFLLQLYSDVLFEIHIKLVNENRVIIISSEMILKINRLS